MSLTQIIALVVMAAVLSAAVIFFIGAGLGWLWRWWLVAGRHELQEILDGLQEAFGELEEDSAPSAAESNPSSRLERKPSVEFHAPPLAVHGSAESFFPKKP